MLPQQPPMSQVIGFGEDHWLSFRPVIVVSPALHDTAPTY
jgi:hypothetical protein